MFFSTNNINPFSHLPSSSYHIHSQALPLPPPPPLLIHHSNHHHDLLSVTSLLPADPQLTQPLIHMALSNNNATITMTKDDGVGGTRSECFGASGFSIPVKKPAKKDRHSKICTAQGVRDRRVRLSIEIAREFFDLQDMLGFDKASKTVEWLLAKSKNAIRELVKMKYGNGCAGGQRSLSFGSEYEMAAENGEVDGGGLEGTAFESKSVELEDRKMKKLQKAAVLLAKESRAKARGRARERTREKMCTGSTTTTTCELKRCPDQSSSHHFSNQLSSLTQLEASMKSDSYGHDHNMASSFEVVAHQVELEDPSPHPLTTAGAAPTENVIRESIVINRKLKPSTILGCQQNLAASNDASCNSSANKGFPNLPQNWDINGAMVHSTFCAITNVNLSTGVQVYGNP